MWETEKERQTEGEVLGEERKGRTEKQREEGETKGGRHRKGEGERRARVGVDRQSVIG